MQEKGKHLFLIHEFWLVSFIIAMIANTKEMKVLMLARVQTLLQSWWSMEGRQKKKKKNPICGNFSSFETWQTHDRF
jgi:hypothetical protein